MKRMIVSSIFIGMLIILSIIATPTSNTFAGCDEDIWMPTPTPYPTSGAASTPDPGIPWENSTPIPLQTSNPQTPVPTPFELRLSLVAFASNSEQPCPPDTDLGNEGSRDVGAGDESAEPSLIPPSSLTNTYCYPQRGISLGSQVVVTNSGTRLRTGPSTSTTVITGMSEGTQLMIIGDYRCGSGHTWWLVQYQDLSGWVAEVNLQLQVSQLPREILEISFEGDTVAAQSAILALPCVMTYEAKAHFRISRGGFVLEIMSNPLPPSFEIYFLGVRVPNADWAVRHNGFSGETDQSVFLGISSRFSAFTLGATLIDGLWEVKAAC